jgi:hypothetical protein
MERPSADLLEREKPYYRFSGITRVWNPLSEFPIFSKSSRNMFDKMSFGVFGFFACIGPSFGPIRASERV